MAIITITRNSYSHGKAIAENVAERLDYRCVGPEIVRQACEQLGVSPLTMEKALQDSPSALEVFGAEKERHVALFRAAFFDFMKNDNIVYHGLAGHIFLADILNVLKVRVVAKLEDRIQEQMRRTGDSMVQAQRRIHDDDEQRRVWTTYLYGMDSSDPELYDIFVNLNNIRPDKAVQIIVDAARVSTNSHAPQMRKRLADLALQAKAEARLLEFFPEVRTSVRDGELFVSVSASMVQEEAVIRKAREALVGVEGLKAARVGVAAYQYIPF